MAGEGYPGVPDEINKTRGRWGRVWKAGQASDGGYHW